MRRVTHLALGGLVLVMSACAFPPRFGTEPETGRGAITWGPPAGGAGGASRPSIAAAVATESAQERQLEGAVRAAEETGHDDLATATALYELAILRRQQGALDEAAALYHRVLAIRERIQGPDHPDVATVLNNLAALEVAREHADAARPLLERALRIRQQALGEKDALTVQSVNNLALWYAAQGDAAAAEPLYQRAIKTLEQAEPPQRDDLDRVLDNYAALLRDTGRDREADRLDARARRGPAPPAP